MKDLLAVVSGGNGAARKAAPPPPDEDDAEAWAEAFSDFKKATESGDAKAARSAFRLMQSLSDEDE